MTDKIYTTLLHLNLAKRNTSTLIAMCPAFTGLVTLAVENVSCYLFKRRNEATAKAMRALNDNTKPDQEYNLTV